MPDEDQEVEPKISLPEVILIGLVFLIIDLIEIVIVFAALDDFWILDLFASSIFIYLFIKGVPPMRQFVAWLLELIPWLGALPLLTIGWGLTVWADRHPSGVLAKAGAVAGAAKGKGAPPQVRGVGARSWAQMERAEKRAGRVLRREEEPARLEQTAARAAGGEVGEAAPATIAGGVETGEGAAARGETAAAEGEISPEAPRKEAPEVPKEALGEAPTPLEKIRKLAEERALEETEIPGAAEEEGEREAA